MKYPKLTNSIDGTKRFTMKIEFRISEWDLTAAMVMLIHDDFNIKYADWYETPKGQVGKMLFKKGVLDEIKRVDIWKKMKKELWDRGTNWSYALEDVECEEEVMEFCKEHIHRYFPEFKEDI
jgi:hypothetical protein